MVNNFEIIECKEVSCTGLDLFKTVSIISASFVFFCFFFLFFFFVFFLFFFFFLYTISLILFRLVYKIKLALQGYTLVLIWIENIDCGYSLEPLRRVASNVYPQSIF